MQFSAHFACKSNLHLTGWLLLSSFQHFDYSLIWDLVSRVPLPREMAIIKNTSGRHVDFMCVQAAPKTVPQPKSKVSWRNIEEVNNLCVFVAFNVVQNTQLINLAS